MPRLIESDLRTDLARLKSKQLYRSPEIFSSKKPPKRLGRFVDFSSNDYLGLSQHPRVMAAARRALSEWGTGSAASRLLSGNLNIHSRLEQALARFKRQKTATVFSSGYLANLGAIQTLVNEKDVVVLDRLCHASLIDGARLSGAKLWVYRHRDASQLSEALVKARSFRRRLVVTDAYFSMDGDVAPLPELVRVCRDHQAMLMIDEAHSTGVYGRTGRGLLEHFGVTQGVDVVMGTLSKALGSVGGFVSGSSALKGTLVNHCRAYIYTTAPSPAASASALESLTLLEQTPEPLEKLWHNVRLLRRGLDLLELDTLGSEGPIVPIRSGSSAQTLRIKESLKARGFFVSAIRPPSVRPGTARIRLSISADHSEEQISGLLAALKTSRGLFR